MNDWNSSSSDSFTIPSRLFFTALSGCSIRSLLTLSPFLPPHVFSLFFSFPPFLPFFSFVCSRLLSTHVALLGAVPSHAPVPNTSFTFTSVAITFAYVPASPVSSLVHHPLLVHPPAVAFIVRPSGPEGDEHRVLHHFRQIMTLVLP